MKELRHLRAALAGLFVALTASAAWAGAGHDHEGMGPVPSLAARDGALQVQGRFCPRDLRASAGVPLADLWRANRDSLMGSAPARALGQDSSLAFQLPSSAPRSKAFLSNSGSGGKLGGILPLITGLVSLILGILSGGGMNSASAFPTSPGLVAPAPSSSSVPQLSGVRTRSPTGVLGIPGQPGGGWLDPKQGPQSSPVGQQAPTPPSSGNLSSGFVANYPTSGRPRITRGFFSQKHPVTGKYKKHTGLDLSKKRGSGPNAYAVGPSSVVLSGRKGGYGNTVILKHPDGTQTLYAHLASLSVGANSSIAAGTPVGPIGSTGMSTGPHLHFEVIQNGTKVDPRPYFPDYPYAY
jgi:murein DD-endopeptidase MepM/ murein hydrolase activator NlpD